MSERGPKELGSQSTRFDHRTGSDGGTKTAPLPPGIKRPPEEGRGRIRTWIGEKLDTPVKKVTATVAGVGLMVGTVVGADRVLNHDSAAPTKNPDPVPELTAEGAVNQIPGQAVATVPVPEAPVLTPAQIEQQSVNAIFAAALAPELRDREAVFRDQVTTDDSITDVVSLISRGTLSPEQYHSDAAQARIAYAESVANARNQFTFKTANGEVKKQFVPRRTESQIAQGTKLRNRIILLDQNSPVPQRIKDAAVKDADTKAKLDAGTSLFITFPESNGSTTYIIYTEPDKWAQGVPVGRNLKPFEILDLAFTLESTARAGHVVSDTDATEGIKQLGSQLIELAVIGEPASREASRYGKTLGWLYPSQTPETDAIYQGAISKSLKPVIG